MVYSLKTNPFAVLGATTRDDRRRIMDLAEEKSLISDHEICNAAKSELTNPRNRLVAEIGWLPGLSPKRATELLEVLATKPASLRSKKDNVPTLALANLLVSALAVLDETLDTDEWIAFLIDAATASEKIDPNQILRDINEDRSVSGFPEAKSVDAVQTALSEHIQLYKESVKDALDRLDAEKLLGVVTGTVEIATGMGTKHAAPLIDEIVDSYELHTHGFLRSEADKVIASVKAAEASIPKGTKSLNEALDKVERLARHWCRFDRPILLSMKSRGLQHELSLEVAFTIRGLVLKLADKELLDAAHRITNLLREVFSELPEMAERAERDNSDLSGMKQNRSDLEKIKPLTDLCEKAMTDIQANPKNADKIGQQLFEDSKTVLAQFQRSDLSNDQILLAKNHLAMALSRCSVAYGNTTDKWSPCVKLLEYAIVLATDKGVIEQVNKNLETSKENERLGGIGVVKRTPSLFMINGCGFTLYGSTNPDPATGSHVATYYFTFVFLPILPICRYRVIQNGNSYRFLSKVPLRPFDKWHLAIALGIIAWIALSSM